MKLKDATLSEIVAELQAREALERGTRPPSKRELLEQQIAERQASGVTGARKGVEKRARVVGRRLDR